MCLAPCICEGNALQPPIVCIHDNLYICLRPSKNVTYEEISDCLGAGDTFLVDCNIESLGQGICLFSIHAFCSQLLAIQSQNFGLDSHPRNIMVCPAFETKKAFAEVACLLGAHLILFEARSYEEVMHAFSNFIESLHLILLLNDRQGITSACSVLDVGTMLER